MFVQLGFQFGHPRLGPRGCLSPGQHVLSLTQPPHRVGKQTPSAPPRDQLITLGFRGCQRFHAITGCFLQKLLTLGFGRLQLGRVITGSRLQQRLPRHHLRPQLIHARVDLALQPLQLLPRLTSRGLGYVGLPALLQRGPRPLHTLPRRGDPLVQVATHFRIELVDRLVICLPAILLIAPLLLEALTYLVETCSGLGLNPRSLLVGRGDIGLRLRLQLRVALFDRVGHRPSSLGLRAIEHYLSVTHCLLCPRHGGVQIGVASGRLTLQRAAVVGIRTLHHVPVRLHLLLDTRVHLLCPPRQFIDRNRLGPIEQFVGDPSAPVLIGTLGLQLGLCMVEFGLQLLDMSALTGRTIRPTALATLILGREGGEFSLSPAQLPLCSRNICFGINHTFVVDRDLLRQIGPQPSLAHVHLGDRIVRTMLGLRGVDRRRIVPRSYLFRLLRRVDRVRDLRTRTRGRRSLLCLGSFRLWLLGDLAVFRDVGAGMLGFRSAGSTSASRAIADTPGTTKLVVRGSSPRGVRRVVGRCRFAVPLSAGYAGGPGTVESAVGVVMECEEPMLETCTTARTAAGTVGLTLGSAVTARSAGMLAPSRWRVGPLIVGTCSPTIAGSRTCRSVGASAGVTGSCVRPGRGRVTCRFWLVARRGGIGSASGPGRIRGSHTGMGRRPRGPTRRVLAGGRRIGIGRAASGPCPRVDCGGRSVGTEAGA
ncbi:hypothetical protein [Nocardia sp. GP40]|uniref:hypothetical protein n=1 Tax=Nocardia sp. GP40 TaxID=3156268 RepID=UPI003D196C2C